jgi:hypothetical protein
MASEIRVDTLKTSGGIGTATYSNSRWNFTDSISAPNFNGTATNATNINISAATSSDTTTRVVLVGGTGTGNQSTITDSTLNYNASTGNLAATSFTGNGTIPVGVIVMWSGSVASIPTGWALCNGSNGTPDLRNRFVVGAGNVYNPGNTGGADSVNLTVTQIPTHGHLLDDFYFAETWGFTDYSDPQLGNIHYNSDLQGSGKTDGNNNPFSLKHGTYSTGGPNSNNYQTSDANGTAGAAHENRPPYYALAYIMKCELKAGTTQNITTTTPTLQELRLNGPLYDQEMDGGAQKGNAGDVLTSLGDGNGVRWESGAKSLTPNGYQKLPGGLIMQWGTIPILATSVTFPIVFPNSLASLQVSWYNSNPGNAYSQWLGCSASTTTGFTPGGGGSGTLRCWMAIGY